jgi:hypothetical protein
VGYGNVFKSNVEFRGSLEEVSTDSGTDGFTLRYQFCGIELGDYGFEYFIADGREYTFVVVQAEGLSGLLAGKRIGWDSECEDS